MKHLSLLLLIAAAPLAARAAETPRVPNPTAQAVPTNASPAWTEWELTSPLYPDLEKRPFLKFSDSRLSASVGLNSLGGSYTQDGAKISVSNLFSTRMAGPPALMTAEDAYSKALNSVRTFQLSADSQTLTLRGDQALIFRLTGRTSQGFRATETKIINVAPELGPQLDGDQTPKYLQLEDLSEDISWGRFSEAKIEDFDFVPGYRYQLRVAVERNERSGDKRLRALEVLSQRWMRNAKLDANQKILEVAPTQVEDKGKQVLLVREVGGQWMALQAPIEGFEFQDGFRYRLQVAPARAGVMKSGYSLVRLLDKMPVIY